MHALVGRNGSGKSTLLKIIQGLYSPSKGRVLLDGADLSQFTREEISNWIGYVPQESILFTGTIRDNIVLRKTDATDEEVLKAAEEAGVHQFVIDMPDGYGTDIGESGANLSGGQRQRIAIARALIGDPPVMILDEPSSSLDRQAEQELRRTLVEIGRDRTVIIVTHSPILLAACDDLVAMDKGKVALAGPAQDILPKLFGTAAKGGGGAQQAAPPQQAQQTQPAAPAQPSSAAKPGNRPPSEPAPRPPGPQGSPQNRPQARPQGGPQAAQPRKRPSKVPPSMQKQQRPQPGPNAGTPGAAQARPQAAPGAKPGTQQGPRVAGANQANKNPNSANIRQAQARQAKPTKPAQANPGQPGQNANRPVNTRQEK